MSDPPSGDPRKRPGGAPRAFARSCVVYCRPESDQAIVASVYNHGGTFEEQPAGAATASFTDLAALNAAIRASLDRCAWGDFNNVARTCSSVPWAAFQASGNETREEFRANFIRVIVKGTSEDNLFYEWTSPEFSRFHLRLTAQLSARTGNHGEVVHYLVKAYLACKVVGGGR